MLVTRYWPVFGFALLGMIFANPSRGAIIGPYAADASTLHLWHMDASPAGTQVDSGNASAATGNVLLDLDRVHQSPAVISGYAGFGNAYSGAGNTGWYQKLGSTSGTPNDIYNLTTGSSIASPIGVGPGQGQFTIDAMVRWDNLDTLANDSRLVVLSSGDSTTSSSTAKIFNVLLGKDSGGNPLITIDKVSDANNGTSGSGFAALLPSSGINAPNSTDWFHLGVAYNGDEGVAGNFIYYWTKVDPSQTAANAVAAPAAFASDLRSVALNQRGSFGVGRDATVTSAQFPNDNSGISVDEVRISSIARGASEFIFVPEPSTLFLTLVGAFSCVFCSSRQRAG